MSKELDAIKAACLKRMEIANKLLEEGMDAELNAQIWSDANKQYKAAFRAELQQCLMKYTTAGDFSHLQSTPGVRF